LLRGTEILEFPNLKQNEIEETLEYQLIDHYFEKLNGQEKIYLCLHLLGSRVTLSSEDIFDVHPNQTVYEVTKALVTEFEKIACVRFENRELLEQALFMHINASLYRYQYGIQIGDDMCEDIIREYPDLFEITKLVVPYLERQIGLPVSDSEVAYLALHFGAHLMIPESPDSTLRILIVCVNGVSTSNMIRREVQKMLPEAQIIGVESITDLKNAQNKCDIIISTVKMKSVVPVIRVHPILTKQDREAILNHPRIKNSHVQLNVSRMFQEIKPYIEPKNWDTVKEIIETFLFDGSIKGVSLMKEEKKALLDLLTEDKIRIKEDTGGWIPTLWEAGEVLLDYGSIEKSYLENIISQIQFYGPYMFITPRVILAHAKPEDGVNHLDATMMICKEEIAFSDFHKANIIIILATEDQEKHLKILKDIADIFSIQNRIDELVQCNSPKEVREYLIKIKE
jgi:transcriptional antiterminator/mannitol/fructose-specific phosphotransferase system IIA component